MAAVGKEGKADLLISWYDKAACGRNIAAWRKVRRNGALVEVCVHPPAQQLTLVSIILHQEAKKVTAMYVTLQPLLFDDGVLSLLGCCRDQASPGFWGSPHSPILPNAEPHAGASCAVEACSYLAINNL